MTHEEYLKQRDKLMYAAEKALEKEDSKGAEKYIAEVKKLDAQYKKGSLDNAYGEPKTIRLPWMGDETFNAETGKVYSTSGELGNSIFLQGSHGMENYARQNSPDNINFGEGNEIFGEMIRGIVTGKWKNTELKNAVTTTSSGVLIPTVMSGRIIDMARNISLFTNAGVPIMPMETNNVTISRVKKDPEFSFKKEGEEGKEVNFELDGVELKSKTCYGYAYVSIEAINSSKNLGDIITKVFASAIAVTTDKGMMYGQQAEEALAEYAPSGIMNDTDISSVTSGGSASYDDIIKGIGEIAKNNGMPSVWAVNAVTEQALNLLKTTEGQYLMPPKALENMKKIVSNQLAYDSSKGSDALVFDPAAMIIGIQNNVQIKVIEDEKCLKNGLVGFQIYTMQDCKTVRPKHICKITGIK